MTTTAVAALAVALAVASAGSASTEPTHFAGVPPAGVKASTPTTGRLLIGLDPTGTTTWNVYADGRVIWQRWTSSFDATVVPDGARRLDTGYVQQRLTRHGVQVLRSKILATGLFEQNIRLDLDGHPGWTFRVRRGDRMVRVYGVPSPDPSWNQQFTKATPAETRAAAWIAALVANPGKWLPKSLWANREIRAFVPARYWLGFDRSLPDLSKLPNPARKALSPYLRRHACLLTTAQTRALLQAFADAGIAPYENHAFTIAFALAGPQHPSDLHMGPALPDGVHC